MKIVYKRKRSKPLCLNGDHLLFYSKNKFFMMDLRTFKYDEVGQIDRGFLKNILSHSRIIERTLRLEPGFSIFASDKEVLTPINGVLYSLDLDSGSLKVQHKFRPEMRTFLSATKVENINGFSDGIYFGEYFSGNKGKNEVSIWRRKDVNGLWEKAYTFKKGKINHIHSLIPDRYRNLIWILTGDFDEAAGFWAATDNFSNVVPIAIGKQIYRSCSAYPLSDGILYATDTQFEENSIRLLRQEGKEYKSQKIFDIKGSSIYSCFLNENYFFSTAIEPGTAGTSKLDLISYSRGKGTKGWYCTIIAGDIGKGFREITHHKKDILPMGLCQFGNIIFPVGQNDSSYLIYYGVALRQVDGDLIVASLD